MRASATRRRPSIISSRRCQGQMCDFIVTSPIGDIQVSSCQDGLHEVRPLDNDKTFLPDERRPVTLKLGEEKDIKACPPAYDCYEWLQDYFIFRKACTEIPLLCSDVVIQDSFSAAALEVLPEAVKMGTTISYKDLARLCGNEKATQAAGQAMSTNPVSLLIPCHRVISSTGRPGNYGYGRKNKIKVWLLKFEKGA